LIEDAGLIIKNPTKRETWVGSGSWRFGKGLAGYTYDNRKITITFEIVGDDLDDVCDKKTQILKLIEDARDSQINGLASPVYLEYQIDTATNPVYFDVVDGELEIPEDLMSVAGLGWYKGGGQRSIKGFILDLICKPFARGTEVQIVTNQSVSPTDDTTYTNYVSWSASAIDGDVPGPLRIRFQNTSTQQMRDFWVGLRDHGTPSSWSYNVLEGEDATNDSSYTTLTNSSYSNGSALQYTANGNDQMLCHWTIPDTAASSVINLRGRVRVILLGSFSASGDQVWLTHRKYITDYAIYPRAINATAGTTALDLGVIDLMAWGIEPGQGAGYSELSLWVKGTNGASITIDALLMIPAEDYKFRKWRWIGYYLPQNYYMEDIARYNQLAFGTDYKSFTAEPSGLPIHAAPGNDGRLYFTWLGSTGSWSITSTAQINVWHTPYYLDIRGTS
jgi:hypothetical protein